MEPIKKDTMNDYTQRMLKVFTYIQRHLDEDVSLEALANEACFSPYHFHRIFRGFTGESVAGHIRRIKLERAATRLKMSDRQVIHIALEAGYETHEAFSRAFKEMFEVSPSQYRKFYHPVNGNPSLVRYNPDGKLKSHIPSIKELNMKVEMKEVAPQKVAFVRHVGPYKECKPAWDTLCTWAGPKGLFQPGVQFIGLSYDDPDVTPSEKIRYDACITIDDNIQPEGEIGIQEIAGGLYAVTTHEGSYDGLSSLYAKLCGQWIPENGYEIRSLPSFEVYLNSPEETPEEELLTDIYVPVEWK